MKKTTKRLLAAVLCLVMVLGALPLTALADTPTADVVYGKDEGSGWSYDSTVSDTVTVGDNITLKKTATKKADNQYEVTLEVQLKQTSKTTSAAAATTLVFDLSNSMKWCMVCGENHYAGNHKTYPEVTSVQTYGTYYIKEDEDQYTQVYYCNGDHFFSWDDHAPGWYRTDLSNHKESNRLTPKTEENSEGTPFYTREQSTSTDKIERLTTAKEAAISFLQTYSGLTGFNENGTTTATQDQNLQRYFSLVTFGSSATKQSFRAGRNLYWVDVSNPQNFNTVVRIISNLETSGATNLDAGLRRANELMQENTVKNIQSAHKNVIAMTDGAATYYVSVNDGKEKNEPLHSDNGCSHTNEVTAATAATLKSSIGSLYTVCVSASSVSCYKQDRSCSYSHRNSPTVGNFLKDSIATAAADGKTYAYNANNQSELLGAFSSIAETVTTGLNAGTVTDNLPTAGVTTTSTDFVKGVMSWDLDPADDATDKSKDGNTTTYTYTKTYTVTIDPDEVTPDANGYVPLNGETTFTYTDATGTTQTANFPIPAGKVTPNSVTVTFDVINGTWSDITDTPTTTTVTINKGASLTSDQIPTPQPNAGYTTPGSWDVTPNTTDAINEDKTFTYTYSSKQTVTVTFTVVGGTWNGKTGGEATSFDVELNYGDTLDGYIPTGIPNASHYGSGTWTDDTPTDNTTVTANVVYTLTYARRGEITITGGTDSKTYNGYEQEITNYDVTGLPTGYKLSGLTYSAKGTNVGSYNGKFNGIPSIISDDGTTDVTNQYTITTTPGKLTITKKDVTITVNDAEKNFGEGNPTFTGTVTGLVDDGDLGTINYKRTSTSEAVGAYENDLTADYTENGNYNVTVENGDFTIKTATSGATLSAAGGTWEYDGTAHTPTVTLSDDTYTVYYKVGGGEWTTTVPSVTNVSEGTVTVSVKATKTGYTDLTDTVTLNVNPAPVTIKVDDAEKYVGEEDPTFTGTVTGLVNLNDLGTIYYYRINSDNAVGTYDDVLSAQYNLNSNYTITVQKGNFEIKEAPAAVLSVEKEVTSITRGNTQVWPTDSATNPTAEVGDEIVWTITVTNSGNADGKFTLTDTLTKAEGETEKLTTFYTDAGCTTEASSENGDYTVAANGSKTYYVEYTVTEDDIGTTLVNKVTLKEAGKADKDSTAPGVPVGGLTVEKTVDDGEIDAVIDGEVNIPSVKAAATSERTAKVGETITWTITVTNYFDSQQTFTLVDTLSNSANVTLDPAPTNGEYTIDPAAIKDGVITPTVKTITATYVVQASDEGTTLVNTAIIKQDDKEIDKDDAPGVEVEGKLSVDKTVYSIKRGEKYIYGEDSGANAIPTAKVGDDIIWKIKVTNTDSANADFKLEDILGTTGLPIYGSKLVGTELVPNGFDEENKIIGEYMILGEEGVTNIVSFFVKYTVKPSDLGSTLVNTVVMKDANDGKIDDDTAPGIKVEDKPNTPSYNPNYNAGVQLEKGEHFNYVIGYSDGTVRPEGNITRAEVATIFFRLLTDESRKTYLTEYNTFTDVEKSMWHNVAISTLARAGVLNGYNDGSFRPDNNITRAEMAAIISRFAELEGSTRISFTDIKGHWAEKSILLAASNGWINGYNDGSFRPDQNITRAETFAMINRVLERKVEHVNDLVSDMNTWVDNMDTTQWYYFDVQEATNYHSYQRKYTNTNAEKWIKKLTDIDWTVYQY